jgi:hypothetical protein
MLSDIFLKVFLGWLILWVLQAAAALPWALAADVRLRKSLKNFKFWACVAGVLVVGAVAMAYSIPGDATTQMRWGRAFTSILHLQLAADFFIGALVLMLRFWPKGGAVALAAFREAIRQPMFLLLVLPTIFFVMPVVPVLPYFTLGEDIKMVKELGYDLLVLLGGVFVVICASTSISDEIEGRTAVTLMSKPIARRQFLVGKFAGIFLAGGVMVTLLGWCMVWMFLFKEAWDPPIGQTEPPDPDWVVSFSVRFDQSQTSVYNIFRGVALWIDQAGIVLPGLVIVLCQVMVLLSISVAMATRVHFTINFIICAAFYFLGHLAPVLNAVSVNRPALVRFMAGVFDLIMPGLEHFDMSGAVVRDVPLPAGEFGWYTANVALYAVTYSVIALLLGLIWFEDKDLA